METSLVMLPSLNKRLEQLVQVADCCQKYSDYERQEVPTQFSTPVLDIIEVINLLGWLQTLNVLVA